MRRSSVLLAFAFLSLLGVAAHAADFKDVHKVVPLDANGRVTVDAHNGAITITPWDQPNVSIDARIEPVEHFEHSEDVQKTEVRVTGGGKEVDIESDYSAVPSHIVLFGVQQTNPPIYYTIHVPATAQLRVRAHNAKVKVTGVKGDVDVATHNGEVDVADIDGGARIETHNGDCEGGLCECGPPQQHRDPQRLGQRRRPCRNEDDREGRQPPLLVHLRPADDGQGDGIDVDRDGQRRRSRAELQHA